MKVLARWVCRCCGWDILLYVLVTVSVVISLQTLGKCAGACAHCGSGQRIAARMPPFKHYDAVLSGFRRAVFDGGAVLLVGV